MLAERSVPQKYTADSGNHLAPLQMLYGQKFQLMQHSDWIPKQSAIDLASWSGILNNTYVLLSSNADMY